ncbi:MAG: hypothetical protein ACRCZ9_08260 [Fusobacteriaceae bacterium]
MIFEEKFKRTLLINFHICDDKCGHEMVLDGNCVWPTTDTHDTEHEPRIFVSEYGSKYKLGYTESSMGEEDLTVYNFQMMIVTSSEGHIESDELMDLAIAFMSGGSIGDEFNIAGIDYKVTGFGNTSIKYLKRKIQ